MHPRRRDRLTAVVSEILVHTLEGFATSVGLSQFFVSAVIVAIVGNAAEHGGAIVIARRGKIRLASEIAVSSAAQVALFVAPLAALLSFLVRPPLPLAFRPVELATIAGSALFVGVVVWDRKGTRREGVLLLARLCRVRRRVLPVRQPLLVGERAEELRLARERVRGPVELHHGVCVVAHDLEALPRSRPDTTRKRPGPVLLEHRRLDPRRRTREARASRRPSRQLKTNWSPSDHQMPRSSSISVRRRLVAAPELRLARIVLDRPLGKREGELDDRGRAGGRVGQHADLDVLVARAEERGEEARHGAVVPVEDAIAAAVEHQPEPPGEEPARLVCHHLDCVHRLAVAEPGAPAAEIAGRRPEVSGSRDAVDPLQLGSGRRTPE